MSWRPDSLAARLVLLLVAALTATHLLAMLVHASADVDVHPLSRHKIEARVLTAYRLAVEHPAAAEGALSAMRLPESGFAMAPSARIVPAAMNALERRLAEAIRQRLQLPASTAVHAQLREVPASAVPNDWHLDIEVALPDGPWLASDHHPDMVRQTWARDWRYALPLSVVPVVLIAVWFGWRTVRPHRQLALAAERLGRGERIAPLPLQGPREVREITAAFNRMQDSLTRHQDERTRMLAAIGHDLRTPLTSLRIRTELVDDASLRTSMAQTLDEMAQMLHETLCFARDEHVQDREPARHHDLGALIDEVVLAQRALGRRVVWTRPGPWVCTCRPVGLKRALTNLVENAARYGEVSVSLQAGAAPRTATIHIDDEGPGIAPELVARAFEPFVRLDPARHQDGGSVGLGLTIARSSIRAHGGALTLHNRPEGGLRATVELPA